MTLNGVMATVPSNDRNDRDCCSHCVDMHVYRNIFPSAFK